MLVVPKQGPEVPKLSLSQIMAMSRDKGPLPVKVKGWVQGTKRLLPDCPRCGKMVFFDEKLQDHICTNCGLDKDIPKGPIVQQVAQHNLLTREFFPMWWFNDQGPGSLYIFIGNDDTGVHELKTIMEDTSGGTSSVVAAVINTVSEFWTYSFTFGAPGTARTIRQVGTARYSRYLFGQWRWQCAASMTELSSEIEQGTAETFEVVYKFQFSEVTP
jgi:ribosomal protein S27AE